LTPAFEERALAELPLDKAKELYDPSRNSRRIRELLEQYEHPEGPRDVSLLEEAGELMFMRKS
jgi:hypothetical protein